MVYYVKFGLIFVVYLFSCCVCLGFVLCGLGRLLLRGLLILWVCGCLVLDGGFGVGAGFVCEVGLVVLICLLAFYVCGGYVCGIVNSFVGDLLVWWLTSVVGLRFDVLLAYCYTFAACVWFGAFVLLVAVLPC